ncbi:MULTISPECIES: hypothetical protein [unclassified Pseudomonas]|uniref:hypothetical protein n=1 Tax=unclassified Pseudomonas TaxID=196821 RepID=UPI001B31D634|nr:MULTISPECIES: hypothetical protein [unclassified Pseudomonas]MBP5947600.1 hypothetical protein [Pseudomonas sp. P9(2020)]MBZ9565929.1 hypothetical protein [Pseudomonas sp. P116]
MQNPWKHSIADVYANNYGNVVQDFLSLVVEPSLHALLRRSDELMAIADDALFTKSFQIADHLALEQRTAMAFCLGIQSLWEQQIRTYMAGCTRQFFIPDVPEDQVVKAVEDEIEKIQKAGWGSDFNKLFMKARGLDLSKFQSYDSLCLLMLLGNVCRHGEGSAARTLREKHKYLWAAPDPLLEEVFGIRPVSDIQLPLELLRSFVHAIVLFWRELERHGLQTFMASDEVEARLANHIRD